MTALMTALDKAKVLLRYQMRDDRVRFNGGECCKVPTSG